MGNHFDCVVILLVMNDGITEADPEILGGVNPKGGVNLKGVRLLKARLSYGIFRLHGNGAGVTFSNTHRVP